jgi:MoaA/NifB/PqqE/SkfB family radical SAM enzyme
MGLKSMRYDSYQYNISETQVQKPIKPVRIEINASNVCNLRCRICSPAASSRWIVEGKKVYGWNEKIHLNLNEENLRQVKNWCDNLDEICFFGGEPLMSEENVQLLDHAIDSGLSKKIALLFNSNGTIFNDEIQRRLEKFKRVRFYFSIDDIGARFEYQRSGASWKDVEKNLNTVYALTKTPAWKNIDFKICCTVSSLNVFYFPEFFEYFNNNFPGLKIFWNLLYDTWELSIQILPNEVKKVIRERLQTIQPSFEWSEGETKTVNELLTYLDYSVEKPFSEFYRYVNRHDVYRKESFPSVFPEFWQILKPYKPTDVVMGELTKEDTLQQTAIDNIEYYTHLSFLENYKKENDNDLLNTALSKSQVGHHIIGAMSEVAETLGMKQRFDLKLDVIRNLFSDNSFNQEDFIRDFLAFGAFRVFKAINDLSPEEINTVLLRKYPEKGSTKTAF